MLLAVGLLRGHGRRPASQGLGPLERLGGAVEAIAVAYGVAEAVAAEAEGKVSRSVEVHARHARRGHVRHAQRLRRLVAYAKLAGVGPEVDGEACGLASELPDLVPHLRLGSVGESVVVAAVLVPALSVDVGRLASLERIVPDPLAEALREGGKAKE